MICEAFAIVLALALAHYGHGCRLMSTSQEIWLRSCRGSLPLFGSLLLVVPVKHYCRGHNQKHVFECPPFSPS